MSVKDQSPFAVGDRVRWQSGRQWSRTWHYGRVTKVTPSQTLTVLEDGWEDKFSTFRRGKYGHTCEHVPALVTARREWWAAKPKTELIHISSGLGQHEMRSSDLGVQVHERFALTKERLDALADEIVVVREWLDREPEAAS